MFMKRFPESVKFVKGKVVFSRRSPAKHLSLFHWAKVGCPFRSWQVLVIAHFVGREVSKSCSAKSRSVIHPVTFRLCHFGLLPPLRFGSWQVVETPEIGSASVNSGSGKLVLGQR